MIPLRFTDIFNASEKKLVSAKTLEMKYQHIRYFLS
jgi:hypothetical protein